MIKTVTMTGADDTVTVEHLAAIQKLFPFVEWGILFSKKQTGVPRFPSREWFAGLHDRTDLRLSLHLCGSYVRDFFATGSTGFLADMGITWESFKRVQLNTHAEPHRWNTFSMRYASAFVKVNPEKEFIFQMDNVNDFIYNFAEQGLRNISGLHDLSHGAGKLPEQWPSPLIIKTGYAGGLGPDNLKDQLPLILNAALSIPQKPTDLWIDMETKIRTGDGITPDDRFDMEKVVACLEICKPYVSGSSYVQGLHNSPFPEFPPVQPPSIQ